MDVAVITRLLDLNRQFYQTFASQFSSTRRRLQPGVHRILDKVDPSDRILDLGCGNGELARGLVSRGHKGLYVGLDFSAELLAEARKRLPSNDQTAFLQVDLSTPGWDAALPAGSFDVILAFAVLHHLPGVHLRRHVLEIARNRLASRGRFIHSVWQFLNSKRMRQRLHPWEEAGLSPLEVDPGDYLLDWREGGFGLRYVHHFALDELETLAKTTGFQVGETFFSDGAEGNLGMYQVGMPAK